MDTKFEGFDLPEENWSKLPHQLIDALPTFSSASELKVVLYVLRHTWGFQEFDELKRITLDEFKNGRKRKDGSRLDSGIGMSENSIMEGIKRAVDDGFLVRERDMSPRPGKPSFYYQLNIKSSKVEDLNSQRLRIQPSEVEDSSEKETLERNKEKEDSKSPSLDSSADFSGEVDWEESELLEVTVGKLSRTFGDLSHLKSNVTQAHNLWDKTDLGEREFVDMVEKAAAITKEAISKGQVQQRNRRMAYFFAVLRERLGLEDKRCRDRRQYVESKYIAYIQH